MLDLRRGKLYLSEDFVLQKCMSLSMMKKEVRDSKLMLKTASIAKHAQ